MSSPDSIKKLSAQQASIFESLESRMQMVESAIGELESPPACKNQETRDEPPMQASGLSLLVFSGERDKLLASFVMATSAAATGLDVNMFFTFWGTAGLKKSKRQVGKKTLVERAFGWMLPGGFEGTKLSKMDMCGLGRILMEREMSSKGIANLTDLIEVAGELGVEINVCEMSMRLMGIKEDELIDYPNMSYCGATSFLETATNPTTTTMFI